MRIQKNKLLIMLIACLIFYPIVVHAEKIFNYQLLAVWQADNKGDKTFPLRDGDRLVDGSGFRIHLFPEKSASFRITFHSAGEESVLWEQETLNEIILPAHNEWYKLDDKRGQEKVVLEAISKTGKILQQESVLIHHISPEITQFSRKFNNNELPTQNLSLKTVSGIANIPLPVKSFRGIEKGFKVLEKIKTEDTLNTRGLTGKGIYRTFSRAVVKILLLDDKGNPTGGGSGVIVDKQYFNTNLQTFSENKDYILTNWHVIRGATSFGVTFKLSSGLKAKYSEIYRGNLITFDAVKDLAIIEVNAIPNNLPNVKLGSIYKLEIGEKVFAIGHPRNGIAWSFTDGSISQYVEDHEWSYDEKIRHQASVIQTQTPINPGNSGGPLLSEDGFLIGINSYGFDQMQNINFAVAVNSIRDFLRSGTRVESQKFYPEYAKIDRNKNGIIDMLLYDENKNGIFEHIYKDDNENGKWELYFGDSNENEVTDLSGVDTNNDEIIDTYFYDPNEDGVHDAIGYDDNQDSVIDKWIDL